MLQLQDDYEFKMILYPCPIIILSTQHILAAFTFIWVTAGRWKSTNRTAQREAIRAAAVFLGWPNGSRVNAAARDFQQLPSPHLLYKWRDLSKKHNVRWQLIRGGGRMCVHECVCVCFLNGKEEQHTDRWWSGVCAHIHLCHIVSRGDRGLSRIVFV